MDGHNEREKHNRSSDVGVKPSFLFQVRKSKKKTDKDDDELLFSEVRHNQGDR